MANQSKDYDSVITFCIISFVIVWSGRTENNISRESSSGHQSRTELDHIEDIKM